MLIEQEFDGSLLIVLIGMGADQNRFNGKSQFAVVENCNVRHHGAVFARSELHLVDAEEGLLPELVVPLGTYAGWNLRDPLIGAPNQRVAFEASYIPFARTASERRRARDPRKSVEERYGSREDYLDRFGHALNELVEQRWVLPEDRAALMARGRQDWEEATR